MTIWLSPCAISLLLLLLSLQSPSQASDSDTLTANQQLSGHQKLISQDGNFALGFFQPAGEGSNGKWYIGIWYNKIPGQTIVWVANREKPVSDPVSSNLIISDGNLVIRLNNSESPTWSTNVKNNTAPNSTIAMLLNTGNLVVTHNSNTSIVLWQSFDDFTDTWLPGNKLSRNKKTGIVKQMIAWKDHGDPTPGMFSIELDPKGSPQYVLLWNRSVLYWGSGNWTGNSFSGVPELSPTNSYPNSAYTFQFVDNDEETYFTYYVKSDGHIFTRAIVDVSGLFQAFVWIEAAQSWVTFFTQPKAMCSVYGACGENSICSENAASSCSCLRGFIENYPNNWVLNDHTGGCRRNVPLKCGNNGSMKAKQDRFYLINSVKLPDNAQVVDAANTHDCQLTCLNNCSCTAYSHNGTCSVWHDHLMNLQDNSGGSSDRIFIRLAASEIPNSETKNLWIIGIIIGAFIIISLGVTIVHFLHKKRRIGSINQGDGPLISFKYSDLQFLTRNFSETLGAGSFGSVFKGVLPDRTTVAVKKLEGFHQGEKQFRAEVSTIGNIHHINLIRLLGFCSKGVKRLLVYEYMPNGSLDKLLFRSSSINLHWKIKHQIAVGIAKGLAYLHEECRDCIIHCDIKPENILLDASYVPKVADFGLAKLLGRDFSRVLTSMRGTVGYLAPEWISGEAITTKADVFSYGMMLFEIMSGKRNLEHTEATLETFFPVLAARRLLAGEVQTLFSPELIGGVHVGDLERICKVACWCVQDSESSRPTMGEIVKILEGLVDVDLPPVPRYLARPRRPHGRHLRGWRWTPRATTPVGIVLVNKLCIPLQTPAIRAPPKTRKSRTPASPRTSRRSIRLAAKHREPDSTKQAQKVLIKKLGGLVLSPVVDSEVARKFKATFSAPLSPAKREALQVLFDGDFDPESLGIDAVGLDEDSA